MQNNIWDILILKKYSLLIWNFNVTGCPVALLPTLSGFSLSCLCSYGTLCYPVSTLLHCSLIVYLVVSIFQLGPNFPVGRNCVLFILFTVISPVTSTVLNLNRYSVNMWTSQRMKNTWAYNGMYFLSSSIFASSLLSWWMSKEC